MVDRSAFWSGLALIAGGLLLAGCSDWNFAPAMRGNYMTAGHNLAVVDRAQPPAGGTFIQETAHDYAGLANMLARDGDWTDVDYFARKGIAAEHGMLVPPEVNGNWAIINGLRPQTAEARERLLRELDNGGRDRFPALAARAQVDYDCWLERTEDNWAKEFDGACRRDFVAILGALEEALNGRAAAAPPSPAIPAPAHQYNVYFEFDEATLTPEGRKVVDTVAQTAKSESDFHIRLDGKADRTGTDLFNMTLSHRRADAVRAALLADGIPASRVAESWDGFRNPPVPTAPGVREPRNRVVEVTLQ